METEPITALTTIEQLTPMQLFAPGAMNPILERIKSEARAAAADSDISTPEGRKAVASLAYKVARTKTFVDEKRLELVSARKKEVAAIDAEGRRFRDEMDSLKDEVRKPLTDWEEADKNRIAEHELMIGAIVDVIGASFNSRPQIEKAREVVDRVWDRNFQEFTKRASQAREAALLRLDAETMRITEAAAKKAEEERLKAEREEKERVEREARIAEEARLKAEAEAKRREEAIQREAKQREEELARVAAEEKARLERERKESEERLQKSLDDARAKAQRDKLAAEERERKAEADRIAAAKRAELDREAARKKAEDDREKAVQAERKRLEDIRKAEEEKRDAIAREKLIREADQEHRWEVHGGAVLALVNQVGDLTSHQARLVVQAIVKGLIPGVSITY